MLRQSHQLIQQFEAYQAAIHLPRPPVSGILTRVVGLGFEAIGCRASVGSLCAIETQYGTIEAEVVGFADDRLFLMPAAEARGVLPGARVTPLQVDTGIPVGMELLGRVVDGRCQPLDDQGPLITAEHAALRRNAINPLQRQPIDRPLDVGVRAINAVITVGGGQRMGIFAGSGVGKSVLLGMMTRGTSADVVVVGLVGERGREVKEFIDEILGVEGRSRAVVVAAPADASPLMRLKGCETAVTIAEYFRDQGLNVLLLIDSLTRYAQAQREIALAVGEPPATKGYPPSVFARLPALVERAGNGNAQQGGITAFFTVLTEGDDLQDPIADASRAILDGHIVLSRDLADSGHFPAIDVEASISRVMPAITKPQHQQWARRLKQLLAAYRRNRDLVAIGAYQRGSDAETDMALQLLPAIQKFLRQEMHDISDYDQSLVGLEQLMGTHL